MKPFRSIEDLHVLAAIGGWLLGIGRDSGWPEALQLRLLGLLGSAAEVSRLCATSPVMHLMLAGLFAQFDGLRPELEAALAEGPQEWASLWQRDQGLLAIASGPAPSAWRRPAPASAWAERRGAHRRLGLVRRMGRATRNPSSGPGPRLVEEKASSTLRPFHPYQSRHGARPCDVFALDAGFA